MASAARPVAVAEGRGSVAIAAPVSGAMIVTGDNNTVDMHLTGAGAVLAFAFRWNRPRRRRRRDRGHPRPPCFEGHVDRDEQIAALLPIDGSPRVVNLYGPQGIGKTHVLVEALNRDECEMRDGTVYLDGRGQSADDLLHAVFDELYECRVQRRDLRIERLLSSRRAVVALEDVALSPADAQRLVLGAAQCRFLVTSHARVLFDGTPVSLSGLPRRYAAAVAEQELGRPLEEPERRAAESIAAALDGHPLALRQAFSRARDEGSGRRLDELEPWLVNLGAEDCLATLTPVQLRAARALAVHGDAALGDEHLAAIAGTEAVQAAVDLEARHDAKSHSPRHSLVGVLAQTLPKEDLDEETERALAHFAAWSEAQRGDSQALLREADAMLALLERAHAAGRWAQVIRLGRTIEGAYALGQRWAAWGRILELVLDAARHSEDLESQAWARHQLGTRSYGLGKVDAARSSLVEALALRERIGDSAGAAATRQNLRVVAGRAPLLYRLSHVSLAVLAVVCALLFGVAGVAGAGIVGGEKQVDLVVGVQGSGHVIGDRGSGDCAKSECRAELDVDSEIVLHAQPALGWELARWDGACSGLGACRLVMTTDRHVVAVFKRVREPRNLTVHVRGKGSVVSHPAGITCGPGKTCRATFKRSRRIELTGAAARGHRFAGWSHAGCPGTDRCIVTEDTSQSTVYARFEPEADAVTLAVDLAGDGLGRVTTQQSGIDCGQLCVASFRRGTRVSLRAIAQPGSRFSGWNLRGCAGETCATTLSRSRTVVAHFEAGERTPGPSRLPTDHELTVLVSGDGTVSSDRGEIEACSLDCSDSFPEGQRIVLTADESGGSRFAGWVHPRCDEGTTCTLMLTRDTTVEARFERDAPPTKHELTVVVSGEGTVSSRPDGIEECATSCPAPFDDGERIILTARAGEGWELAGWDGAGCGSDTTCKVTLDGPRRVEAGFRRVARPTDITITDVVRADGRGELKTWSGVGDPVLDVSGRLDGAPPSSTVQVSYQLPGSSVWSNAAPGTAQDSGAFSIPVALSISPPPGTWTFKARYAGTRGYLPSESDRFEYSLTVPG